jgi:hypothetical protein
MADQVRRAAPQGTESGDFDTRWLLFLIPIVLFFLLIVFIAWRYNIKRRKQKQQRSVLRNVTLVIADEERAEERRLNRGNSLASRMSRMGSIRSSNHTGHTSGYGTSSTKYASLREKHLRGSRDLSFYPPPTGKRPASLLSHQSSQMMHGTHQKQPYHNSGVVGLHSPPPLSPDSRIISLHRIDSDAKSQQDARNAIISAGPIHGRRRSSLGLKRPDLSGSRAGSASGHGSGNEKASSHGHNEKASSHGHNEKASSHGHGSVDQHSRMDPGEASDSSSHVAAVSWAPISTLPTAVTRTQSHDRLLHRNSPASAPIDALPSRSSSKGSGTEHVSDPEASDGQRGSSWKTRVTGGQRTRSSALTAIGERGPEVPAKEAELARSGSLSSSNSHGTHRGILKTSDRLRAMGMARTEQASASPSSAGTGSSAQASQLSSPAARKPVPSEDSGSALPRSVASTAGVSRTSSRGKSGQSRGSTGSTAASAPSGADTTAKPVLNLQIDEPASTSSPQFTASPIGFIRKSADMARPLGMPWKLKRANTGEHEAISKASIGAPSAIPRASFDGGADVSRSNSDTSAWAYQSKAAEWRAASAAKLTGDSNPDDSATAADSSAGTAEGLQVPSLANPIQRTPSIGAAGSVFKENFEDQSP